MKDLYLLILSILFLILFLNNNYYLDFLCLEKWNCKNTQHKENHDEHSNTNK